MGNVCNRINVFIVFTDKFVLLLKVLFLTKKPTDLLKTCKIFYIT